MRRLLPIVLTIALIVGPPGPCIAWDFSLRGSYETGFSCFGNISTAHIRSLWSGSDFGSVGRSRSDLPGVSAYYSAQESGKTTLGSALTGFNGRGWYAVTENAAFSRGAKFILQPTLTGGSLSLTGVLALGAQGTDFDQYWGDRLAVTNFSGSPPFDRYYKPEAKHPTEDNSRTAAWEKFWITWEIAEGLRIYTGSRDVPAGTGTTIENDSAKEITALDIFYPEPFRFTIGTGAVTPKDRPNEDLARPVPFAAPVLAAYTAGYGALTAVYTAGAAVVTIIYLGLKEICSSTKKDSDSWSDNPYYKKPETSPKSDSNKAEFFSTLFGIVYSLPYSVFCIADDYSNSFPNRKPFHFFAVEWTQPEVSAGTGLFSYPNLDPDGKKPPPGDQQDRHRDNAFVWSMYGNYNDGRYVANAQGSVFGWSLNPLDGTDKFYRGYHWFSEVGTVLGPFQAMVMAAVASGRSLEGLHDNRGAMRFPIGRRAMDRYDSLMFRTYGGGNFTFEGPPGDRYGMMADAYAFGARVEFGTAANLNLWGSYLWAHRLESTGTYFGHYTSSGRDATEQERRMFATMTGKPLLYPPANYGYVSNGFLGHEFNIGVDWRAFDTWRFKITGACWLPGDWFREAHQRVLSAVPATAMGPDSGSSAVLGLSGMVMIEF